MNVRKNLNCRLIACLIAILVSILSFICHPDSNSFALNYSVTYKRYDSSTDSSVTYVLGALSQRSNSLADFSVPENRVPDSDTSVVQLDTVGGTGFIIGSHLIATCAHCVFDNESNKFIAETQDYKILIKDANNNTIKTISSNSSTMQFHVPYNYYRFRLSGDVRDAFDYALIYVEDDLSQYGIFEVGVATDDFLNNNGTVITSGFPAEIDYGNTEVYGNRYKSVGVAEYYSSNSYNLTGQMRFASSNCTSGGNSGGPAYFPCINYNNEEENTVIGIVTGATMSESAYTGTSCVRITTNILRFFFYNSYIG